MEVKFSSFIVYLNVINKDVNTKNCYSIVVYTTVQHFPSPDKLHHILKHGQLKLPASPERFA